MPVKMIANDIASDYDLPQDRPSITDVDLRFIDALLAQGVPLTRWRPYISEMNL